MQGNIHVHAGENTEPFPVQLSAKLAVTYFQGSWYKQILVYGGKMQQRQICNLQFLCPLINIQDTLSLEEVLGETVSLKLMASPFT